MGRMGLKDTVRAAGADEVILHHECADDAPLRFGTALGPFRQQAHGVGLQALRDPGLALGVAAEIAARGDRPRRKYRLMRLRVDMEYGLRLGRQLQIFQHVLLFLLLLKLLQLGFPFLLTDVQQVLDLLLGVSVFQDQDVGKGVRVDEFLWYRGSQQR